VDCFATAPALLQYLSTPQVASGCSSRARMEINGSYGILSVDLTCSYCCDFEFGCLVLQRGGSGD